MLKFKTYEYADVSTAYLEESDLDLIGPGAPAHIFEHDDGVASIFYVSEDYFDSDVEEWKVRGLSERFITIMRALRDQGIHYVRFDADGGDVEGMKPVEETD